MPRQARKQSKSGIYHIMLRGIDRQMIFEDAEDYAHFLDIIKKCYQECNFTLYAYCLMGNHVHLLMKDQTDNLETIFKKIGARYVYYYNVKYQRVGHLFQDRFKSEPVEDDAYFLTVLRYIHQNPVKAKLCARAEDYPYSSFAEYLHAGNLVDTDFVFGMIDRSDFIKFNNMSNSDTCMDIEIPSRIAVTETQARVIIEKISRCKTVTEFQGLEEKKREAYIKKIYGHGVSIRQLSRLTGITKGMIEKYLRG